MSAVFFLLLALVISGIGCTVVYLRQRTPRSLESGIDEFRREMEALGSSADDHDELPSFRYRRKP
jgi:hypothetical protein